MAKEVLQEVIVSAQNNDQKAFNTLFDHYWQLVYNFQLKNTSNPHTAEELSIQTLAKAFDRIETYNPQYAFSTWLLTISKNLQIDKLRKNQRSLKGPDLHENLSEKVGDATPSPEELMIAAQSLEQVLQALKILKPEYQKIIQLRFFEAHSYKELSKALDQPINTIKVKLLRAKKVLAEHINLNDHHTT
jgi:RNA polymerase sigma factor (sigma-70 family)